MWQIVSADYGSDSGTSEHMTENKQYFVEYRVFEVPESIIVDQSKKLPVYCAGKVSVSMLVDVSATTEH